MYSHHTTSCKQPRCMVCSLKEHDMEEHPPSKGPKCINCKQDHPTNHKACNTRHIQLGLKPIPNPHEKPHLNKADPKRKGHTSGLDHPPILAQDTLNIIL